MDGENGGLLGRFRDDAVEEAGNEVGFPGRVSSRAGWPEHRHTGFLDSLVRVEVARAGLDGHSTAGVVLDVVEAGEALHHLMAEIGVERLTRPSCVEQPTDRQLSSGGADKERQAAGADHGKGRFAGPDGGGWDPAFPRFQVVGVQRDDARCESRRHEAVRGMAGH